MTSQSEERVHQSLVTALEEFRTTVREHNRKALAWYIRDLEEREPPDDLSDEDVRELRLNGLESYLENVSLENMQRPSDALARFDEVAEQCELDGAGRARESSERSAKLEEYVGALNEAFLENTDGDGIQGPVTVPAAFVELMKLVDSILGPGLPHYRSMHQTPFFEGFQRQASTIANSVITGSPDERRMTAGLSGDWEVGAGWRTGANAGADSFVLYCRNQSLGKEWDWRYIVKAPETFNHLGPMDDLGEFLKAYASFKAPDLNNLEIDAVDPFD